MHIGFLTPEYVSDKNVDGGLANYIKKISLLLKGKGHQVSVFVISDTTREWVDEGIMIYEVKRFHFPGDLYRLSKISPFLSAYSQIATSKRLEKMMWKVFKKSPFDILQVSSYMAPGYTLIRNGRIPLVCRVSSYSPLLRSAYGRRRTFSDLLSDWLEVRQVTGADGAFAPSKMIADIYARFEGLQPVVIRTPPDQDIPPEMDDSYYKNRLEGRQYLLFFGTLSRIKGIDLLSDILANILEKHKQLYFVFIGRDDGLPDGQKVFDNISSRNKAYADRLIYNQALPKRLLYPVIKNSLGVLMPSRIDNYPNACLEAQSYGIPVIGTYQSSLDEMIIDGETGFLAMNSSPVSLENAIERLLNMSPEERAMMRRNILNASENIRKEDQVDRLVEFYNNVIEGNR